MFEHLSNFKDISGAHLVRKILEAIFPIIGRRGEVIGQHVEERVAFTGRNGATEADFSRIGDGNQDQENSLRRVEAYRTASATAPICFCSICSIVPIPWLG